MIFNFLLALPLLAQDPCLERICSIDMGSGTTKFVCSDVNVCGAKPEVVGKPVFKQTLNYSLQSQLELLEGLAPSSKPHWKFKNDTAQDYVNLVLPIVEQVKKLVPPPTKWVCGATAAVRNSVDRNTFLTEVKKNTGVFCELLEQVQEGIMGHTAVVNSKENRCAASGKPALSFDVGGGSAQITFKETASDPTPRVGRYLFGAESFRNHLKKTHPTRSYQCPEDATLTDEKKRQEHQKALKVTPNPIGKKNLRQSILAAKGSAGSAWTTKNKPIFERYCTVGIGGVHNFAIQASLNHPPLREALKKQNDPACAGLKNETAGPTDSYSYNDLLCMTNYLVDKNDCELRKIFPPTNAEHITTNISNMILVLGFMEYMGLKNNSRIFTQKVDMNNQLLLESSMAVSIKPSGPVEIRASGPEGRTRPEPRR